MDVTTINAIADKLGIAVQSAEEFINYILPQMVAYNIAQGILLIICTIVINAIVISLAIIGYKKDIDLLSICCGVLSIFAIVFGIVALITGIDGLIGWANWPEVMLFNKIVG